ncbi:MAG: HTH domain-containing protein [Candidatus Omnitrophica bacterium]|nr:HTH domain-containing protein [Candidatus Omnitrophota bacterium]
MPRKHDTEKLRKILDCFDAAGGKCVSGEKISEALKCSRANVWKCISELRAEGYEIDAVTNSGYTLRSAPDKLLPFEVARGLNTERIGKGGIRYYETIGSTNDVAYRLAENGAPEGTLVIAEKQTAGRGRFDREWV